MSNQNSSASERRNRVLTALVPVSLHEAFKTASRKAGKTISQLISELMRDYLSRQGFEEINGEELAARLDLLLQSLVALSSSIRHLDVYVKLYLEAGGDIGDLSNAETVLEKMRPRVAMLQERDSTDRHIESDWLQFQKYILYKKEYRIFQSHLQPRRV